MCAPGDSAAVTAFGEALASDELYHALDLLRDIDGLADHVDVKPVLIDVSGKPLPPHNIMLEVAERDDPLVLIEEFLSKDWLGHVAAGYIVRWIVSRWNEPNAKRDASLTKAASSIEQWCTKFKIKGGKSQNVTKLMAQIQVSGPFMGRSLCAKRCRNRSVNSGRLYPFLFNGRLDIKSGGRHCA